MGVCRAEKQTSEVTTLRLEVLITLQSQLESRQRWMYVYSFYGDCGWFGVIAIEHKLFSAL